MKKLLLLPAFLFILHSAFPQCSATIVSHTNVSCNGGCDASATVSASGGTSPYTYSWSIIPAQATATAIGLCAGNYMVTIQDAVGCTATTNVAITQPTALFVYNPITDLLCYGTNTGCAAITVVGGTPPYTYVWLPSGQTGTQVCGLYANTFTVTVTDAHGCTATTPPSIAEFPPIVLNVNVIPASCSSCCNGSATVSIVSGGNAPYTYLWSPGGGTRTSITGLCPGTYSCCVTDVDGCSSCRTDTVSDATFVNTINSSDEAPIIYPNPFSENATLFINEQPLKEYAVWLTDMLGKRVKDYGTAVSKTLLVEKQNLPSGMYVLTLRDALSGEEHHVKLIVE